MQTPNDTVLAPPSIPDVKALARGVLEGLGAQVRQVVSVPDGVLEPVAVALVAGGHCLIQGIPGTGKTLLSRALSRAVDCTFKRIQFTSDLMPSDVVGSSVWRTKSETFEFVPGPLFANVVLADEVNRTSSRTLSCLLEAMEEGEVTVDGVARSLGSPFTILATRNPIEFHGTFPIPEAALDRFLVHVDLGYPDDAAERAMYRSQKRDLSLDVIEPVVSREELLILTSSLDTVQVSEPVAEYAYRVARATRDHESVALGVSPRAAISWIHAARARAILHGRDYVLPDDLKGLARAVLAHRVFLKAGGSADALVDEILARTPVAL